MAERRGFSAVLCGLAAFGCAGTEETLISTKSGANADGGSDPGASFQIQLSGGFDDSVVAEVYDLDLNGTSAASIAALHSRGRKVGCYFSAGTRESFRDDADEVPDSALGNPHPEYPSERWLDVRSAVVRDVMIARVELARTKGCDAIHPANMDVSGADSGFPITRDENAAYTLALANAAHERGISVAWSDEPDLFPALEQSVDWGIAIQCIEFGRCERWLGLARAGKPVFVVEVGDETDVAAVCPAAAALGLPAIIKDSNYTAFRIECP